MAVIFTKETFEGGSLPATFDSDESWGGGSIVIDSTSKCTGTYSAKVAMSAEGAARLLKSITAKTEFYAQVQVFIPTAFAWGSASAITLMSFTTGADSVVMDLNLENWGDYELTLWSETAFGWKDTGLTLSENTLYTIEIYVKVATSGGLVKVWVNNTTAGSPNYASASSNTGSTGVSKVYCGVGYADATFTGNVYFDNYVIDSAFIGAGASSAIKTVNALAKTSVKTINGLAIASVKTWDGLA